ncbi:hypothetical protein M1373_03785 [Candidatus Marsarchaeota archaeon]|nr:hypothetical protein [Candidatus Marsarchaeota archaeon]MCL5405041.1 hypothetical protein [Candidatus Marsarchaeota archaeon]
MAKEKKPKKIRIRLVKLRSELDLGRLGCSFSQEQKYMFAAVKNGAKILFIAGENIAETRLAYYVETERLDSYAVYSTSSGTESFRISGLISEQAHPSVCRFPIMQIDYNAFIEKELKPGDIYYVRAEDYRDIIRIVVSNSLNSESLGMVYSFVKGDKVIIGSLEIIADDKKVFVYAYADIEPGHAFFSYDYSNGSINATDAFSENSYIYVRIINLAEGFPLFK